MTVTSFPEPLGPIYTPTRPERRSVGPVQPSRRVDDSIRRQRELARTPVPVEKAEVHLANLSLGASDPGEGYGRNARRAVSAYSAMARVDDREFVSQMLGVDEFA